MWVNILWNSVPDIVDVIFPDNVPRSEEFYAIGVHPTRWIGPIGMILDRAPDLVSLNQVISSLDFYTDLGIAIQAVIPDGAILDIGSIPWPGPDHDPAPGSKIDIISFKNAIT